MIGSLTPADLPATVGESGQGPLKKNREGHAQ